MTESIPRHEKPHSSIPDTRSAIQQAIHHLTLRYQLPDNQARQWILQEARAKRASIDQVARAILSENSVTYRYSIPL